MQATHAVHAMNAVLAVHAVHAVHAMNAMNAVLAVLATRVPRTLHSRDAARLSVDRQAVHPRSWMVTVTLMTRDS